MMKLSGKITKKLLSKVLIGSIGQKMLESLDIDITDLRVSIQYVRGWTIIFVLVDRSCREAKGLNAAFINLDCSISAIVVTMLVNASVLRSSIPCYHNLRQIAGIYLCTIRTSSANR